MTVKLALLTALGIVTVGFVVGLAIAWCLTFLGAAPYWIGLAQGAVQVAVTSLLFQSK